MSYWSVVYTDAAAEPGVRHEIEKLGFGAFLPWHKVGTWHGDQLRIREKPLIPRYVLFNVPPGASWSSVCHLDGANRVLAAAGALLRVSATEMAELVLAHASGAYNAIQPRRDAVRRRRRKRRRRPRHGKVAKGPSCV